MSMFVPFDILYIKNCIPYHFVYSNRQRKSKQTRSDIYDK